MRKCLFRFLAVILCFLLCLCSLSCGEENISPKDSDTEASFSGSMLNGDGIKDERPQAPEYELIYTMSEDGDYYTVSGYMGNLQDSLTIPAEHENKPVRAIGDMVFTNCESIKEVIISEGIRTIGHSAFKGCVSLESLQIPEGVYEIGHNAFEKCSSLTYVKLPSSLAELGYGAFISCTGLVQVELSSNLAIIRHNVFSKCYRLVRIVIPKSVSEIQEYAFNSCYSLIEVENLSEYITVTNDESNGGVGLYALNIGNCDGDFESKLTFAKEGYAVFENGYQYILLSYTGKDKILELSIDIEKINDYAFYGAKNLCKIKMQGVCEIGNYAFYDCTNLMMIDFGSGDLTFGSKAFRNCVKLAEVIYSGNVDIARKLYYASDFLFFCHCKTHNRVCNLHPWELQHLRNLPRSQEAPFHD